MSFTPMNAAGPSPSELIELVQMQDVIIDELSTKYESLATETNDNKGDDSVSTLVLEMRDKLAESVAIMEEQQRKNTVLSRQLQKLRENTETLPTMTSIELHSLLEKERDSTATLRKRLMEAEKRGEVQIGQIETLQFELLESQKKVQVSDSEAKRKIDELLNEISIRQQRFDEVSASAASTEASCAHLEENCNLRINLAEEHCNQLRNEVALLIRNKKVLNERIVVLTDDLAKCRMKLTEIPLSVLTTPNDYEMLVSEQRAVIDSLSIENATLKEQLKEYSFNKKHTERRPSRRRNGNPDRFLQL